MANADTPLMRQYSEVKSRHPDALLFFRMGDFYELFFEDASLAAGVLEIALTARNKNDPNPIPMCGVPHHAATNYINRLVSLGFKVAICEQLEDPTSVKGIVKRDVVRVISPGTQIEPDGLESKAPSLTHAVILNSSDELFWATADYSTGSFCFGHSKSVLEWLTYVQSQSIKEILFSDDSKQTLIPTELRKLSQKSFFQPVPRFYFHQEYAEQRIFEQFQTSHLNSVHPMLLSDSTFVGPIGALIKQFQETQRIERIPATTKIFCWDQNQTMELDSNTIRALELLPDKRKPLSLFEFLDKTKTAMGGRLLRERILRPLVEAGQIENRLDQVESFFKNEDRLLKTQQILSGIYDLERLLSRIGLGANNKFYSSLSAREVVSLSDSVLNANKLIDLGILQNCDETLIELSRRIRSSFVETLPPGVREGGLFKKGVNSQLDELIDLCENGENWLAKLELREREATKIPSLKVRYNRVFGYYIEVTKAHLQNVPDHYVRKQTMVGAERYITEELKEFEQKIVTAEKKRWDLEFLMFKEFCLEITQKASAIANLASEIAQIDVSSCLGTIAKEYDFVRPSVNDNQTLHIDSGWHPIVATLLKNQNDTRHFIPNSVEFSSAEKFLLITGPNMGGKSTIMRQCALIVLLAQMGSFVPAKSAEIGIVDRILTRIGANDNISEGESTFMVEMNEISFILRTATKNSLLLLDEIGRGTSTYDGLSLAWAISLDIAQRIQARTMFATHYHELTELSKIVPAISNYRVRVEVDSRNEVKFCYKLEAGAAERSYGLLVAKLAGLPKDVLKNAARVLKELETRSQSESRREGLQLALNFFSKPDHPEKLSQSPRLQN